MKSALKQFGGIALGLVIGIAGGRLFQQSLAPEEASVAEALEMREHQLRKAENELRQLRTEKSMSERQAKAAVASIRDDLKSGRGVSVEDLFDVTRPMMATVAPVFERIRVREQRESFDRVAGTMAKEYGLNDAQKKALSDWLEMRAEDNAREFSQMLESENSSVFDYIQGMEEMSQAQGIDEFMEAQLTGESLARYREDRLAERTEEVTGEANGNLHRFNEIVGLDESQQDEAFLLFTRGAGSYRQGMEVDGMAGDTGQLSEGARNAALLEMLRPDQRERYEAYQAEQIREMQEEMAEIGLRMDDTRWFEDQFLMR